MPRPLRQLDDSPPGPPPWLPLAWFACALVWLLLGGLGLIRIAPQLAGGNLYSPHVFAVTHALTLGVLASAIFGALHQFIPVVLGVPLRFPRIAILGFWFSQLGTASLVGGFWRWDVTLQAAGWMLLFLAVGCASWNVLPARRRAAGNRVVGGFVSLGHSALGVAMFIALARIGQGLGWWQVSREGLLVAHLHLGLVGFGSLTVVGMGSKMLPAFLKARVEPDPSAFIRIGWLAAIGLTALSVGTIWRVNLLTSLGGLLTLFAVVQHLAVMAAYWRGVGVSRPDPALGFIAAAILWYAVTAVFGSWILVQRPADGRLWAAYVLAGVLGWLIHLIVGVLHRIGPRLMAALVVARGMRLTAAQGRAELPWPLLSWMGLAGMAGGTGLLTFAVATESTVAAPAAALLLTGGVVCVVLQALGIAGWLVSQRTAPGDQ